ncbi:MAG: nitroreductase family protein [Eubacterium sp.]|nr:nitroreductase family protein [Eubacterium sp.]
MELEKALYLRRSVRKYTDEPIKEEELQKIIDAGETAPIAVGDHEKTHITVVTDEKVIEAIRKTCLTPSRKTPGKMIDPLHAAKTLILVSATDISDDHIEYCNVACVIENMILQATALNIGSCYTWGCLGKLKADEEVMKMLKIPEGYEILSGLTVGYANKPLAMREKEERIAITRI